VLILTRRIDEAIVISDDITVTILEISGERVKLGIDAPRDITILRQELRDQVRAANIEAAEPLPEIDKVAPKMKDLRSSS